ncbi:MAG: hypothetical protein CL878_01545 [Dehalococcoidia bacterium]|nr:hypothetical protein [Dehalococcoidia bacterium]
METLEAFALYLPVGLYVILIELLVLGMSLGLLPSLREQQWGVLWEAILAALGILALGPLLTLMPSAVAGFGFIAGLVAMLFPLGMLWRRYAAWASSFSVEEEAEYE